MSRIAEAYRIAYHSIASARDFARIGKTLSGPGPVLCEVVVDPAQGYERGARHANWPTVPSCLPASKILFRYLSKAELAENMLPRLENVLRGTAPAD